MSHDELTELLERGAGTPKASEDLAGVWRHGRRRRTLKRASAGIGAVGALIAVVMLVPTLISPPQGIDIGLLDGPATADLGSAWLTLIGDPDGAVELRSVSPASDGGVLVSGQLIGSVTVDDRTLSADGGTAGIAYRLDDDGEIVWAELAGSASTQGPRQVEPIAAAATDDGELIVTGVMSGDVKFGDIEVAAGQGEGYTAKIGADGQPLWVTRAGTVPGAEGPAPTLEPTAITSTDDGGAIIVGTLNGTVDFADTTLDAGPGRLAYAVRLDTDGQIVWAESIATSTGSAFLSPTGVTATADGVIVTGMFAGTTTFGPRALEPTGDLDGFAVKITDGGQHTWVTATTSEGGMVAPQAMDATPDGGAIVVASLRGSADFGGTRLEASGVQDGVVFKVTADGEIAWATLTESGPDQVDLTAVTVSSDGSATATGRFTGPGSFAGVTPQASEASSPSGLLLRLDTDGRPLGTRVLSNGTGAFLPAAIMLDAYGHTTITGSLNGQHAIDDAAVDVGDQTSGFILQLHATSND